MALDAKRRFIRGAIAGAEVLHAALPWERGPGRARAAFRRALKSERRSA